MSENLASRIDMEKFRTLMASRKRIAVFLSILMLAIYYGFILVLAFGKEMFAIPLSGHVTLWLPIGIGVILTAWVLTGVYVFWANGRYDRMVNQVKDTLR